MYGINECRKPHPGPGHKSNKKKETSILDSLPMPTRFRSSSNGSTRSTRTDSFDSDCALPPPTDMADSACHVHSKELSPLWSLRKETSQGDVMEEGVLSHTPENKDTNPSH
mmetsp:Transcript_2455/g.4470  ORF Transcript_2455/g.4470 Transcript_2455/m.4470 type:complete len:111 (+) Transcript_2455:124-456(+)